MSSSAQPSSSQPSGSGSPSSNQSSPKRRGKQTETLHPRLKQFQYRAKKEAEAAHDAAAAEKKRQQAAHPAMFPTKAITKRQLSNKRSAEICRAAKGIYIQYLEKSIVEEEQKHLLVIQKLFNQTEANCMLREKIKLLESRLAKVQGSSWLPQSAAGSNDNDQTGSGSQFFLDHAITNEFRPEVDQSQETTNALEWVLDEVMEPLPECREVPVGPIKEMFQTNSSDCTSLDDVPMQDATPRSGKVTRKVTDKFIELSSPVSIYDTAPQIPCANFLGPSVRHQATSS